MSFALSTKANQLARFFVLLAVFFLPMSTSGMEVGLSLSVLLVLCSGELAEKKAFLLSRPALWVPSLLFLLMLISTVHGIIPWHARLYAAKKYLPLLFIPFLAWLFTDEQCRKKAIGLFLFVMASVWVLGTLYFFLGFSWSFFKGDSLLFHDHVSMSFLSAFCVFVFLCLQEKVTGYKKYVLLALVVVGCCQIFFINRGRTGDFIFFGLVFCFCIQKWRWKGVFGSVVFVGVLFAALLHFSPIFHDRILGSFESHAQKESVAEGAYISTAQRLTAIKASVDLLKQHLLVGVGTGSFYDSAAQLPWMDPKKNSTPVGNDWLNTAVQTGVLGFFIIAAIYFIQWRETKKLPSFYKEVGRLLIFTMLLGGLISSPLVDAVLLHFYCIFAALCFACPHQSRVKNT